MKMKVHAVVGRGEKSLLGDPGSEFDNHVRESEEQTKSAKMIVQGRRKKKKKKVVFLTLIPLTPGPKPLTFSAMHSPLRLVHRVRQP